MIRYAALLAALAAAAGPCFADPPEQEALRGDLSFQQSLLPIDGGLRFAPSVLPTAAASWLARAARITVSGEPLMVGVENPAAARFLDCAASSVQHTIRSCRLAAAALPAANSLGRKIDGAALNVHFQGKILNMSVEFAAGNDVDGVLAQLRAAFGREPKLQYWADGSHLYASYIWVDGKAEVEVTKTVKGAPGDGKTRMYVSSLVGGLPISPDDVP